jgi:hypothetical protein
MLTGASWALFNKMYCHRMRYSIYAKSHSTFQGRGGTSTPGIASVLFDVLHAPQWMQIGTQLFREEEVQALLALHRCGLMYCTTPNGCK